MAFTEQQARVAALWWAQFLPGAKNISASNITGNIIATDQEIPDTAKRTVDATLDMTEASESITPIQYETFIEVLCEEIMALPIQRLYNANGQYKQLGHTSIYEPPHEVKDAAVDADIDIASGLVYFPWRTAMLLLDNGQIHVNGEIISIAGSPKALDTKTLDFTNAPYVVAIIGDDIVVEVRPATSLYTPASFIHEVPPEKVDTKSGGYVATSLYYVKDGRRAEYQALSAQALLAATPDMAQRLPIRASYFSETNPIKEKDSELGEAMPIDQGNGHYRQRTKPLRVIEIMESCTVGYGDTVRYANKGDWLLFNEKTKDVKLMSRAKARDTNIDFHLALPDGTILSNKTYEPGMTLPELGWRNPSMPRSQDSPDKFPPR
jgi:hypothetical protein